MARRGSRPNTPRGPAIRVIRNRELLGSAKLQWRALHVAPEAATSKSSCLRFILPECLERMVAVGEAHPTAAIIGSYFLMGEELAGSGIEWPTECIPGRAAARLQLLDNRFIFGSPTNVLYRADLLAKRQPFFDETSLHDDTDLCYEVLADADMGFVHQVLSFSRREAESDIDRQLQWSSRSLMVCARWPKFLSPEELRAASRRFVPYLRLLGEGACLPRPNLELPSQGRRGRKSYLDDRPRRPSREQRSRMSSSRSGCA